MVERDHETSGDRLDRLKHIGIDELSYRRHHEYVTVVVDHERGAVVWSSKGKNAETLKAFFEELGPERCKAIESVTIDMSKAYISAVKDKVPRARLVFDRFHVQRLVQDALDETRRDEVRAAETKEEARALQGRPKSVRMPASCETRSRTMRHRHGAWRPQRCAVRHGDKACRRSQPRFVSAGAAEKEQLRCSSGSHLAEAKKR